MSVGRRLMLSLAILVGCTALLGGLALFGLQGVSHRYSAAEEQYQDLRSLYEVGFRAASVRALLNSGSTALGAIQAHLEVASEEADKLARGQALSRPGRVDPAIERVRQSIRERLDRVALRIGSGQETAGLETDVNRWLGEVVALVAATQGEIVQNRTRAAAELRTVLIGMACAMIATILLAAVVGVRQYRSIMRPLRALDGAVTRVADIQFDHRVGEQGDREFRRLIAAFNRMSVTIDRLHSSMREQVEVKSRQLVRSEQLASVGSLAAGLAHEINNPLGIIAGYAQTTRRRLIRRRVQQEREGAIEDAAATFEVIAEEAFRARDIARQLLEMAQPAETDPSLVHLAPLVRRAVDLVGHLPIASGKDLVCRVEGSADELVSRGHAAHLLQVFINLLTNGLEATTPGKGRVGVTLSREGDTALIAVNDNGCGMDEETLAHAFDPFFTDKPRRGLSGCGLGLSISHAIIERHGGRLFARSESLGLGSTFTIELPIELAAENAPGRQERDHAGIA